MVSARVTEIDGWGNLVCSLVSILGILRASEKVWEGLFSSAPRLLLGQPPHDHPCILRSSSRAPSSGMTLGSVGAA